MACVLLGCLRRTWAAADVALLVATIPATPSIACSLNTCSIARIMIWGWIQILVEASLGIAIRRLLQI